MKVLKQVTIIMGFALAGEILHALVPLPIPANIYGMILLFLALQSGKLPLAAVRDSAKFFIEIMTVMFLPSAVSLMVTWRILRPAFLAFLLITIISTIAAFGVTGRVTQAIMRRSKQKGE